MPRVTYIPTQTPDESSFTSDRAALHSPTHLFLQDAIILFKNLRYVPHVFLPARKLEPLPGIYKSTAMSVRDTFLTANVVILEFVLLFVTVPAALLLPGWQICLCVLAVSAFIYLLELPMWGGLIVRSQVEPEDAQRFEKEKWHFINGIATSYEGLQTTCDRLATTFKRPITGIHNRSYGIIGDILECMIQRCFGYSTTDVRCTYECLKLQVLDPSVEKVVVIAHSQGGIIISLVLDRMFVELPSKALGKLEIYTFGSAASHFNNPLTHSSLTSLIQATSTLQPLLPRPTHVIPIIEHYANELDMVPRWGVLHSARRCPGTRYAGRIFMSMGASGHLFNEHYLDPMFPLSAGSRTPPTTSSTKRDQRQKKNAAKTPHSTRSPKPPSPGVDDSVDPKDSVSADAEDYVPSSPPPLPPRPPLLALGPPKFSPFLDRMVDVDYRTATKRAEAVDTAREAGYGVMPAAGEANAGAMIGAELATSRRRSSVYDETQAALGEGAGRTVRQLSRLWMYVGGGEGRGREGSVSNDAL